jgi:oligopeptide/dipeptide ABC transporter ATP-binding protein
LLEVHGVSKTFQSARRLRLGRSDDERVVALDDVSLSVPRHQTFALVGESGSGKTTLARVIMRLTEPDSGHVILDGDDLSTMGRAALTRARRRIQMVFQDPYSSLNPRIKIGEAIAEAPLVHGVVGRGEAAGYVEDLLGRVGLPGHIASRLPRELSGGQRQRVAIARAIAVKPEVLVADEAVSSLDVSVQAQILNLFESLRTDLGLTMVFISHQLPVVAHLADVVAVMYQGRIVESGPSEKLFASPRHPYTVALLQAQPGRHRRGQRADMTRSAELPPAELTLGQGCSYRDRCPMATELCSRLRPSLEEIEIGHHVGCHHVNSAPALREPRVAR